MMETLEDAPDPFFGIMSVGPSLPSPYDIPQVRARCLGTSQTRQKGLLSLCRQYPGVKGGSPAWCRDTAVGEAARKSPVCLATQGQQFSDSFLHWRQLPTPLIPRPRPSPSTPGLLPLSLAAGVLQAGAQEWLSTAPVPKPVWSLHT